jgi:hypothetical protein
MLNKRDRLIIEDLKKFRVMDRDSISEIYFKDLKNPQASTNNVLLRLIRDGHIERSTAFVPYVYFSPETNMKKNSQKVGHFLAILKTYKEMLQHGTFNMFLVEPKYGKKGMAEPDIFCIYRNTPFFIEVQNSYFNEKQINEKLDRYEELYKSGIIQQEAWQPEGSKHFPTIIIISEQRFAIEKKYPFRVMQTPSFTHLLQTLKTSSKEVSPKAITSEGVKIKIG